MSHLLLPHFLHDNGLHYLWLHTRYPIRLGHDNNSISCNKTLFSRAPRLVPWLSSRLLYVPMANALLLRSRPRRISVFCRWNPRSSQTLCTTSEWYTTLLRASLFVLLFAKNGPSICLLSAQVFRQRSLSSSVYQVFYLTLLINFAGTSSSPYSTPSRLGCPTRRCSTSPSRHNSYSNLVN